MSASSRPRHHRRIGTFVLSLFLLPAIAFAQSPWETAATRLQTSFTGTLANALALVAIAVGGYLLMFGDGAGKRMLAGLIAGVAMAIGAERWLTWLFK